MVSEGLRYSSRWKIHHLPAAPSGTCSLHSHPRMGKHRSTTIPPRTCASCRLSETRQGWSRFEFGWEKEKRKLVSSETDFEKKIWEQEVYGGVFSETTPARMSAGQDCAEGEAALEASTSHSGALDVSWSFRGVPNGKRRPGTWSISSDAYSPLWGE